MTNVGMRMKWQVQCLVAVAAPFSKLVSGVSSDVNPIIFSWTIDTGASGFTGVAAGAEADA